MPVLQLRAELQRIISFMSGSWSHGSMLALLVLSLCTGCRNGRVEQKKPLVLIVSGDTAGWIVPCGCTSNQSGGLLRRGTYVNSVRNESDVIYVDVGGALNGTSDYDREKFEAILRGELSMDIQAHNIGAGEARLGPTLLGDLKSKLHVPLISCNVHDPEGKPIGEPLRIVVSAGRRVALVGVLSDRQPISGVQIDPPRAAILETLHGAVGDYDTLVVLAYLSEEELANLASELPEADVIVGGPTGQSIAPRRFGPTLIASATNKGKFLARLQAPADGSSTWQGNIIEMDGSWQDDVQQQANLRDFYRRLSERDLAADQTPFLPTFAGTMPTDFQLVGTDSCRDCHAGDCSRWESSGHAQAWQSLTRTGAEVDAYCQQCHSTGFGLPGGFVSLKRSPQRTSVGCEACHGPSKAHVRDPHVRTAYFGQALNRCDRCHDRENSPQFSVADYWLEIKHGEKLK